MTELGAFSVDTDSRTVRGILLPFGQLSRTPKTKNAPMMFSADSIELPADPSIVTLNRGHDQFAPLGRATYLEKRREGVYAEFAIAKTPEGDQWLNDDYPAGKFKRLSAEVAEIVREAVGAAKVATSKLTGGAVVPQGAFEGAALFAADDSDVEIDGVEVPAESSTSASYKTTSSDGSEWASEDETTEKVEDLGGGKKRITRTTVSVTEVTDPSAEDDNQEETVSGTATAPETLAASAANLINPSPEVASLAAEDVFDALIKIHKGAPESEQLLAALTDIKIDGAGALPAAGVLQPNWLGELWAAKAYSRRYMPLIRQGTIKALTESGFTVATTDPEPVQAWAGNKSALHSSGGSTGTVSSVLQRWGWAADVAREYYDLPGGEEVLAAFMRLVAKSYARVTDRWTRDKIVTAATANITAPAAYPAAPANSRDYPAAVKQLIQGIDYLSDPDTIDANPSFAIVNDKAWQQIIYMPADALPAWLKLSFGIRGQAGSTDDGSTVVTVVKGDIGIDDTAAVLVGDYDAAHVNEKADSAGVPISINALDMVNGGVDVANVGYTQYMNDNAEALVIIGAADEA